jgi:hypothetical protein
MELMGIFVIGILVVILLYYMYISYTGPCSMCTKHNSDSVGYDEDFSQVEYHRGTVEDDDPDSDSDIA